MLLFLLYWKLTPGIINAALLFVVLNSNSIYLKNDIFMICSRESAKCTMTAQMLVGKISYLYKSQPVRFHFTLKASIFKLRPLFCFLCLIDTFYTGRCVSCVQYIHLYIYIYIPWRSYLFSIFYFFYSSFAIDLKPFSIYFFRTFFIEFSRCAGAKNRYVYENRYVLLKIDTFCQK